jgi:hypothetical protein
MALRAGHANGSGVPRVEVLPVDELPAGTLASARSESSQDRMASWSSARLCTKPAVTGGDKRAFPRSPTSFHPLSQWPHWCAHVIHARHAAAKGELSGSIELSGDAGQ